MPGDLTRQNHRPWHSQARAGLSGFARVTRTLVSRQERHGMMAMLGLSSNADACGFEYNGQSPRLQSSGSCERWTPPPGDWHHNYSPSTAMVASHIHSYRKLTSDVQGRPKTGCLQPGIPLGMHACNARQQSFWLRNEQICNVIAECNTLCTL